MSSQGNLVAVKHLNRKRVELTRKVLFELKHVGGPRLSAAGWGAQPVVPWVRLAQHKLETTLRSTSDARCPK